jgi:hypothetical protein
MDPIIAEKAPAPHEIAEAGGPKPRFPQLNDFTRIATWQCHGNPCQQPLIAMEQYDQ